MRTRARCTGYLDAHIILSSSGNLRRPARSRSSVSFAQCAVDASRLMLSSSRSLLRASHSRQNAQRALAVHHRIGKCLSTSISKEARAVTTCRRVIPCSTQPASRSIIQHARSLASLSHSFSLHPSTSSAAAMSSLEPPQPPPTWKHTPEEVLDLTNKALEKAKQALDKVAALDSKDCTFETVSASCLTACLVQLMLVPGVRATF